MGENGLQNRLLRLHFAKEPLFLQCHPCSSQTTRLIIRGRAGLYGPIENHVQYIGCMGSKSYITNYSHTCEDVQITITVVPLWAKNGLRSNLICN